MKAVARLDPISLCSGSLARWWSQVTPLNLKQFCHGAAPTPLNPEEYANRNAVSVNVLPEKCKNAYFCEIKPALIVLRMFGRFPYKFTDSGPAPFSLLSVPAVYTGVYYLFSAYASYWLDREICEKVLSGGARIDVVMFSVLLILFSMHNLAVPLSYWLDAPRISHYIHDWIELQELAKKEGISLKYGRSLRIATPILMILTVLIITLVSLFIPDVSKLGFIQYVPIIISIVEFHDIIWIVTLLEIQHISEYLIKRIEKATTKEELSCARRAKLRADLAVTRLGDATGTTLVSIGGVTYVSFVLCVYCMLRMLIAGLVDSSFWGLFVLALFYFTSRCAHCEAAQYATSRMRDDFRKKLMDMKLEIKPEGCLSEIKLILSGITLNPPVVKYNGFFTVDRRFFTNFLCVTATYLIVLLQFSPTTKDVINALNSTESRIYKV